MITTLRLIFFLGCMLPFGWLAAQNISCQTATEILNTGTFQSDGPNSGNGCNQCLKGATHADWFQFTALADGLVDINSCAFFGPNTNLWVYRGNCNSLELIDNDSNSCGGFFGNAAIIQDLVVEDGVTYYLEWDNAYDSSSFVFDFTFTPFGSGCNAPVRYEVDSTNISQAFVSWESVAGSNATYEIEYGPAGFDLGSGQKITGTVGVDGPPVTISGLEDGTFYDVYLHEICEDGSRTDTLDEFFRTAFACRTPFGFTFNVDSIAPDFARIDWASFNEGATFNLEYGLEGFAPGTGTTITGVVGTDGPPTDITGLTERTTYDYYYFEVCANGNSDTLGPGEFTTTAFCPDPDNIEVLEASDNNVALDWDTDNTATYTIEYGAPGFVPGTGTTVTGNVADKPVVISGLTAETYYHAYLIEDCDNGFNSDTIPFTFSTLFPAPTNDSCATAQLISCGETYIGSTDSASAGDTPGGFCGTFAFGPGVWFQLDGSNQSHTLSLCKSNFNTEIMVFEGSCDSLVCVAGNGDSESCPGSQSEITFESEAGTTYYVWVGSQFGARGIYHLEVSCGPLCEPKPQNDDCGTAQALTVYPENQCQFTGGSNACASVSPNFNICGFLQTTQDVWYEFTPQTDVAIGITLNFNEFRTFNVALYDTCGGQIIDCLNDINSGEMEVVEGLEAGATYKLQVWNNGGDQAGEFDICVSETTVNSIQDVHSNSGITLYPNPANTEIKLRGLEEKAEVAIMDATGRTVMQIEVSNEQAIRIESLSPGMYQVWVQAGDVQTLHRLVVR